MCMIRLSPEKTSDSTPGEDPVDLGRILLLNVCIYFRIGTYDDFALPNKPLETCCSCMIWSLITEGGGVFSNWSTQHIAFHILILHTNVYISILGKNSVCPERPIYTSVGRGGGSADDYRVNIVLLTLKSQDNPIYLRV